MRPLFDTTILFGKDYKNKSNKEFPMACEYCNITFLKQAKEIKRALAKGNYKTKVKYCSKSCQSKAAIKFYPGKCKQCKKKISIKPSELKKSKTGNSFCSSSCSATYNNTHKTTGTRRSKLEVWLEIQLILLYPDLEIQFNNKKLINSELDIYIPSLRLAIELNGIFHYKPIYGEEKFKQIKRNDRKKKRLCKKNNITLRTINISKLSHFSPKNASMYLRQIISIVDSSIVDSFILDSFRSQTTIPKDIKEQ